MDGLQCSNVKLNMWNKSGKVLTSTPGWVWIFPFLNTCSVQHCRKAGDPQFPSANICFGKENHSAFSPKGSGTWQPTFSSTQWPEQRPWGKFMQKRIGIPLENDTNKWVKDHQRWKKYTNIPCSELGHDRRTCRSGALRITGPSWADKVLRQSLEISGDPDTTRWKHMETHGNSGLVKGEVPSTASSWKGSDTYLTLSSNRSKQVIAVSLAREVNYLKGKSHPCPFGGQFISPQCPIWGLLTQPTTAARITPAVI